MARPMHHPALRYAMPATVVVLTILGLTPMKYTGWIKAPSSLVFVLEAPISKSFGTISRWLAPADPNPEPDAAILGLEEEKKRYELLWRQAQSENQRLRKLVEMLQGNRAFDTKIPINPLAAPVIATSSDPSSSVFKVRRGSRDGVVQNTVAVVGIEQLVGRVIGVTGRISSVCPITDDAAGPITGSILFDVRGERKAEALLVPWGDGTLRGDVEYVAPGPGEPAPPAPKPGMVVRVDDPEWPASAQMLVIGYVERVEMKSDTGLRHEVFVRPTVELRRVGEVVLRIPVDENGGEP